MNPIHTVFTLGDDEGLRYVGVTTQALSKRLHDMRSASKKPESAMYATPVAIWLRSLSDAPVVNVVYEGTDKELANETYCSVINDNVHTGKLLNSSPGKRPGIRTEFIYHRGPSGKTANPDSGHAQASILRKLRLQLKQLKDESKS